MHIFICHTSPLRTLTLSRTGALLVTSSTKGTLLRIYSTEARSLLSELRRGTDQADIWSVSFADPDTGRKVACSSDKGTIHVWDVGDLGDLSGTGKAARGSEHVQQGKASAGSAFASASASANASAGAGAGAGAPAPDKRLSMLKPYLPAYFSSQWSDMHWRVPVSSVLHGDGRENAVDGDDVATCVFVPRGLASMWGNGTEHGVAGGVGVEVEEDELVVITRSGAYFRLSTSAARPADADPSLGTGTGTGTGTGSGKQAKGNAGRPSRNATPQHNETDGKKCRMLEYRKLQLAGDGATDEDGFERWE